MGIKGCTYVINGSSYDEANQMAIYYATITGNRPSRRLMERLGFTYTDTITAYGGTSVLYTLSRGSWV